MYSIILDFYDIKELYSIISDIRFDDTEYNNKVAIKQYDTKVSVMYNRVSKVSYNNRYDINRIRRFDRPNRTIC